MITHPGFWFVLHHVSLDEKNKTRRVMSHNVLDVTQNQHQLELIMQKNTELEMSFCT